MNAALRVLIQTSRGCIPSAALVCSLLVLPASVRAADVPPTRDVQAATASMAQGEVRKVDKPQGKLTLRHGPIANLDMPAMTMVFRVADPKMLDAVKEGDKVLFAADRLNGALTVTAIEAAAK